MDPAELRPLAVLTTGSVEDVDGVAVTIEPAGGSKQPTSEPVLRSVS